MQHAIGVIICHGTRARYIPNPNHAICNPLEHFVFGSKPGAKERETLKHLCRQGTSTDQHQGFWMILKDMKALTKSCIFQASPRWGITGRILCNSEGFTSVHVAAHLGTQRLAEIILQEMKDVKHGIDARCEYRKTALHVVSRKGYRQLFELFLGHLTPNLLQLMAKLKYGCPDLSVATNCELVWKLKRRAKVMVLNKPAGSALMDIFDRENRGRISVAWLRRRLCFEVIYKVFSKLVIKWIALFSMVSIHIFNINFSCNRRLSVSHSPILYHGKYKSGKWGFSWNR